MNKMFTVVLLVLGAVLLASSGNTQNAFTPDQVKYGPPPPSLAAGAQ